LNDPRKSDWSQSLYYALNIKAYAKDNFKEKKTTNDWSEKTTFRFEIKQRLLEKYHRNILIITQSFYTRKLPKQEVEQGIHR